MIIEPSERWVKSGLLGQGIDAHYDIYRVTETSHGPVIAMVLISHVTEEARRTASERADLICSIPNASRDVAIAAAVAAEREACAKVAQESASEFNKVSVTQAGLVAGGIAAAIRARK